MGRRRRLERQLDEILHELERIDRQLGGLPPEPPPDPWQDLLEAIWVLGGALVWLGLLLWIMFDG